jgi:hypothetical protein
LFVETVDVAALVVLVATSPSIETGTTDSSATVVTAHLALAIGHAIGRGELDLIKERAGVVHAVPDISHPEF